MEDRKIIERARESLSFIEQLQNQIQLCREAMSDLRIPLNPKVEALETLLWAKLKEDKEYMQTSEKLRKELIQSRKRLKENNPSDPAWRIEQMLIPYIRNRAKQKFKAIMVFINQKGYMPLGEE